MRRARPVRKLAPEERILWKRVASTVAPMHPQKPEHMPPEEPDFAETLAPPAPKPPLPLKPGKYRLEGQSIPQPKPVRKPAISPGFDRPVYRKIAKGRTPIDATLDLHHMSQDEAHARLQSFLTQSHALGLRHVLVITGKGTSPTSEGILRRMVPVWLETLTFASLVSGYQSAARGHGGEGAFYIRLRRRKNERGDDT